MTTLNFSLSLDGVLRVRDAITCLAKFSETIGLVATGNGVVLTALNSSKTASASIEFEKDIHLHQYNFLLSDSVRQLSRFREDRLSCQFFNKALLSVFKARIIDSRDRDTAIERCDVHIQDEPDKVECRLIVRMICRHGVKKTYKLTYESVESIRAMFDRNSSRNRWSISSHVLKAFSEYFGPRTEHLDMYYESGRMLFTSYTEKVTSGAEILKQPLQTSVAVGKADFGELNVEERVHVGISVKDFRAIIIHAESLKANITALYSEPALPLQLSYGKLGLRCEFTLMTIGAYRGGSVAIAPLANVERTPSAREPVGAIHGQQKRPIVAPNNMPPPSQPASRSFVRDLGSQRSTRAELPPPQASVDHGSLFLGNDDDDDGQQWEETNYDNEEDMVTWDIGGEMPNRASINPDGKASRVTVPRELDQPEGVPPTQRLSQVRGLFDD